jgi:hypothetical protein
VTAAPPFTPTVAGTYRWVATFDSTNPSLAGVSSGCQDELIDIGLAPSSIETVPSTPAAGQPAGTPVTDEATVTAPAGITPTGTVTFRLFGPNNADCAGTPVFVSDAVALPGAGPFRVTAAPPFTPTVAGSYRWVATFDSTNPSLAGVSSGCQDELIDIGLAPSSIETVPSTPAAGQPAGTPVTDEATVTAPAGITPTGTVTFRLFGPNNADCSGTPAFVSNAVPLPGAAPFRVTAAPPFTPTVAGTYRWVATFDSTNSSLAGVSSGCQDELIDIGLAPSSIETVPSATGLAAGSAITDEATVTAAAGITPTGTVTFRLFGPNNAACTGDPVFVSDAIALPGVAPFRVTSAPPFTPTVAGTYRWVATFDSTNSSLAGVSSGCQDELIDIGLAPSSIETVPSTPAAGQPAGTPTTDQATVTAPAGITPTGTVTFRLYGPNNDACDAAPVFVSDAIALPGAAPFTVTSAPPFSPTVAGMYRWVATFDSTNPSLAGNSSGCQDELIDIGKAPSSIETVPSTPAAGQPAGTPVTDEATVTAPAGITPTGTVTFRLYGPKNAACTGSPAFVSNAIPLPGGAAFTVTSAPPFTPTAAGTYRWVATFNSTNPSLAGNSSGCQDELIDITKTTSTITTTVFDSAANAAWTNTETAGASAFDTAAVGPRVDDLAPTGRVTYSLFSGDTCATSAAITRLNERTWPQQVTLSATGLVPNSQATGPLASGEYSFRAVYSGDDNYAGADSACEPFSVATAPPPPRPAPAPPPYSAPPAPAPPAAQPLTGLLLSHYLVVAAALLGVGVALIVVPRRSRTRRGQHFRSAR